MTEASTSENLITVLPRRFSRGTPLPKHHALVLAGDADSAKRTSPSSAIDKSPPRKCSRCDGRNIDLGLRSYQRATRRASADSSLSLLTASRTTELIDGTTHLTMGSAPLEGQNRSPYAGDASGRAVVTSGSALSSKTSFTRSGAEHMIPAADVTNRSAGSLAARKASARHSNERGLGSLACRAASNSSPTLPFASVGRGMELDHRNGTAAKRLSSMNDASISNCEPTR